MSKTTSIMIVGVGGQGTLLASRILGNAVIEEGAVVGESPENMANVEDWGVAVIGNGVTIGKGAKVEPCAMIDSDIGGAE